MWNFNSWVRKKYPWWGINSSFPLGKEVFSAINWPFCCTWPHWNEVFFEDFDNSREFLITSLKKFTRNIKILSKPLIPIRPGTTQRSNKSGKNLFAHRKTFFYFPTKESSISCPAKLNLNWHLVNFGLTLNHQVSYKPRMISPFVSKRLSISRSTS